MDTAVTEEKKHPGAGKTLALRDPVREKLIVLGNTV